jgi:hypothetical protein
MQALMLVADSATLLPEFKRILATAFPAAFISDIYGNQEFTIKFSNTSRVCIEYYGTDLESIGWEEQEIAFIKRTLPVSQHVYSIAYRGLDAAKSVIAQLADSNQMLVDNDFGTLMVGEDFVRKVVQEPNWNWYDDLEKHDQ